MGRVADIANNVNKRKAPALLTQTRGMPGEQRQRFFNNETVDHAAGYVPGEGG